MVAAGGGRIVNVSSRGAFQGEPDHPAYGACKAGLNSLGQSMAQALESPRRLRDHRRPRVRGHRHGRPVPARPGAAAPSARPLNRAATPQEVAKVVVFLATPGAESTTGAVVDVNGASYLRT